MYRVIIATTALLMLAAGPLQAREFYDLQFPDKVTLTGTDVPLRLNGIGFRTKFFFKIYIGALYTADKAVSRDAAITQTGPKRVLMHFVYDEVESAKLVSAWNEGFEANTTPEKLETLRARIAQFNALFPTVHAGDVVMLDYVPNTGTRVTINDKVRGVVEGADFNAALLDIWLGEVPADESLKEAMLGQ
jgi:Chalcone isomerase-like